ncbi:MAG: 30S ribosomal protein S7 [Candidatus Dojkabacteria bacterium]
MRGKKAIKRHLNPDMRYNSLLVAKLINSVMYDGKKETARIQVYKALDDLAVKTKVPAIDAIEKAFDNVKPKVEVRSRRVGGANFQVPVPVSPERQQSLAIRWILESARSGRKDTEFWVSLSRELQNAYKKEGSAFKKKEEVFRMAEANKAFAQFA